MLGLRRSRGAAPGDILTRGTPAAASDASEAAPDEGFPARSGGGSEVARWTGAGVWKTRLAMVAVWTLVLCGPATLVWQLSGVDATTDPTRPTAADAGRGQQTAATGYAEQVVVAWLTTTRGEESSVAGLLPAGFTGAAHPYDVTAVTVINATSPTAGVWSVQITAQVSERPATSVGSASAGSVTDGTDVAAAPVWLTAQVPVATDGTGWATLSLPAIVAAPPARTAPDLPYRESVSTSDPLGVSVAGFLTALVTSSGDVSRYLAPGTSISPIGGARPSADEPDDLVKVGVDAVQTNVPVPVTPGDGATVHVLTAATVTRGNGDQLQTTYAMTWRARSGRWEIVSIDPAPLTPPQGQPGTQSGTRSPAQPDTASPGSTPTSTRTS